MHNTNVWCIKSLTRRKLSRSLSLLHLSSYCSSSLRSCRFSNPLISLTGLRMRFLSHLCYLPPLLRSASVSSLSRALSLSPRTARTVTSRLARCSPLTLLIFLSRIYAHVKLARSLHLIHLPTLSSSLLSRNLSLRIPTYTSSPPIIRSTSSLYSLSRLLSYSLSDVRAAALTFSLARASILPLCSLSPRLLSPSSLNTSYLVQMVKYTRSALYGYRSLSVYLPPPQIFRYPSASLLSTSLLLDSFRAPPHLSLWKGEYKYFKSGFVGVFARNLGTPTINLLASVHRKYLRDIFFLYNVYVDLNSVFGIFYWMRFVLPLLGL